MMDEPTSDLAWLQAALFRQPGLMHTGRRRSSTKPIIRWATLPARGTTRRLVPTSGAFAAEAFGNQHDAMSPMRLRMGRAASSAVRSGALRIAPHVDGDADAIFEDPAQSVIAAAGRALGESIGSCAITLGPARYNRKPVVQLFDQNARTIGFLKVGANQATSEMVATEAAMIDRLARPTTRVLEVPQVLWHSVWQGRSVACFSPATRNGEPLAPAGTSRLTAVAQAIIAAGGGRRTVLLRDSEPFARLSALASNGEWVDQDKILDQAESAFGHRSVSVGLWHGDFSPWNMISTRHSTSVLDWEFADPEMPIGSDLLHNRVMVATHLESEPAHRPLEQFAALGSDIPELTALSVAPQQHQPHLLLYLFELMRRDAELSAAGLSLTGFGQSAARTALILLAQAAKT